MTLRQKTIKRIIDVFGASAGLFILFPLMIFVAIRVLFDSKGPIFFFQERIGHKGMPFTIVKFRSMFPDSEKEGPALSMGTDLRVTKWGLTMRRWKLDELPQLYNILKGDMSFVGPRPERKYFIDKIAIYDNSFDLLQQVKPGLTSWGMINCGYASTIDQLIHRLKYDVRYIENYSLLLDFFIISLTLRVFWLPLLFRHELSLKTKN